MVVALVPSSNDYYALILIFILSLQYWFFLNQQPYQQPRLNQVKAVTHFLLILVVVNSLQFSAPGKTTVTPAIVHGLLHLIAAIYIAVSFGLEAKNPSFVKDQPLVELN